MFVYSWEARPQNRPPLGNDISRLGSELLRIPVTRLHNIYEYSRIDILDIEFKTLTVHGLSTYDIVVSSMESGAYLPLQVVVKPYGFPLIFQAIHGKCSRRQWRKIASGSRRQFPTPKWVQQIATKITVEFRTSVIHSSSFLPIYVIYILSYCFSASLVTIWDHEICWFLINDRRYQEIFGFVWK